MKATIVGAGNMGTAIAYAMRKLSYDVEIVETDYRRAKTIADNMSVPTVTDITEIKETDIVISAATYFVNEQVAKHCIASGFPYCDLGGNPETSKNIQAMALAGNIPVFTDLGLAPGLANIIAEHITMNSNPRSVMIRVGGLPQNPTGSLQYGRSWSVEGLRNEYTGHCEILRDGKIVYVTACSEADSFEISGWGHLESFHTKGGLSTTLNTMVNRGVVNCEYRTMRFVGHSKFINFLLHECKLSDEEFERAIVSACPVITDDQVLIAVSVDDNWCSVVRILSDDVWTAMQKATAFPAAAVGALMAAGEFTGKQVLCYSDIPVDKMQANLDIIGGLPTIFG